MRGAYASSVGALALLVLAALASVPLPVHAVPRHDVSITDFAFEPATTTLEPGDFVLWFNFGQVAHSVVSDDARFADSATIAPGSAYQVTFPSAGTYPFHCGLHPAMTGRVQVVEGGVPPSITMTSPAEGARVAGSASVRGTVWDPDGDTLTVEVRVDQGNWMPATLTLTNNTGGHWQFAWDSRGVPDGNHLVAARVGDGVSTVETQPRAVTVRNAAAPVVAITSPAEGATVAGTINITGTFENPYGFSRRVEVRTAGGEWRPATTTAASPAGRLAWAIAWDTRQAADGVATIEAQAVDASAIVGSVNRTVTVANQPTDAGEGGEEAANETGPAPAPAFRFLRFTGPADVHRLGGGEYVAQIENFGNLAGGTTLRLRIGGRGSDPEGEPVQVSLQAGQRANATLTFVAGDRFSTQRIVLYAVTSEGVESEPVGVYVRESTDLPATAAWLGVASVAIAGLAAARRRP